MKRGKFTVEGIRAGRFDFHLERNGYRAKSPGGYDQGKASIWFEWLRGGTALMRKHNCCAVRTEQHESPPIFVVCQTAILSPSRLVEL